MPKTALLIVNLGSPDSPATSDVRKYLRQFLNDPYVIDIPAIARFFLLNFIILPFRPAKSAEAYSSIWTERGSPLKYLTEDFTNELKEKTSSVMHIDYCMRYGSPSIESAIEKLVNQKMERVIVAAMYPQYSEAATATVWHEVFRAMKESRASFAIEMIGPFYKEDFFLNAWAANIQNSLSIDQIHNSHFLFSFHGLPERHLLKLDTDKKCLKDQNCCDRLPPFCYRAHCIYTARSIAKRLNLTDDRFSISFQSRLGRAKWIEPDTEDVLRNLAEMGKKNVAIVSPAFVADCLETLEELNIRARELFIEAGGEQFHFLPSLNSNPEFVAGFADFIHSRYLSI